MDNGTNHQDAQWNPHRCSMASSASRKVYSLIWSEMVRHWIFILLPTLAALTAFPLVASTESISDIDTILHFDQPHPLLNSIEFKFKDELKPKQNDFRLIQASFLSNNIGERWAIVTLENTSLGQRLLKNESIVAIFADGSQGYAHNLDEKLEGKGQLTKAVTFGVHTFPILNVTVE
jgi:hypothetical protein